MMPGRVLVVEDSATNRKLIRLRLSAAYYDVIEARNGEEALELAHAEHPDLVLLDVMMPGIDGYEVCRRLKTDSDTAHIPIVMLTALDGREDRVRGLETGADDFLSKPFDDLALLSRVASLTRMKMLVDELAMRGETARGIGLSPVDDPDDAHALSDCRLLIVSAGREDGARLRRTLSDAIGCSIKIREPLPDARVLTGGTAFDVVLLDSNLAGLDPLRLGSMVRARPETRQSATLLVVGKGEAALAAKALEIGFNDYISDPVDPVELVARVRLQLRRKRYSDRMRESMRTSMVDAMTDPLTGVYNRRYANAHLEALLNRKRRPGDELTLMMLDLDRFKSINDQYGHVAGDAVLREFARRLQANVRSADVVARIGGEEFMVIMPAAGPVSAAGIAERVRQATAEPPFGLGITGASRAVTVSIGYAVHRPGESVLELIQRADEALYASKNAGRNRATLSDAA